MAIVSLAHDRVRQRIKDTRFNTASSLVEISGVLFEERRQNSAADHIADERIGIRGAESFGIPLGSLTVSAEPICRLLHPGDRAACRKRYWIEIAFPGKLEFLLCAERE